MSIGFWDSGDCYLQIALLVVIVNLRLWPPAFVFLKKKKEVEGGFDNDLKLGEER